MWPLSSLVLIVAITQLLPNQAAAAVAGPLKAGAGRVDITQKQTQSLVLIIQSSIIFMPAPSISRTDTIAPFC